MYMRYYHAKSSQHGIDTEVSTDLGIFKISSVGTGEAPFGIFHKDKGCDIGDYLWERYLDEESRIALKNVFEKAAEICGEQQAKSPATYGPQHLFATQGLLWRNMAKLVDGECKISSVSGDVTGLVTVIWVEYKEVSVAFHDGSAVTVMYQDLQSRKTTIEPALAPAPPAYQAEAV